MESIATKLYACVDCVCMCMCGLTTVLNFYFCLGSYETVSDHLSNCCVGTIHQW